MADIGVVKPRANRAVAALSEAHGTAAEQYPALLPGGPTRSAPHQPVTRHATFEALEAARRQRCPLAAARQELADLQEKPRPRDELAVLPDAAVTAALWFLGPLSADGAALAATCRRAQRLCLSRCAPAVVCLVPDLLPSPARLSAPVALDALCAFLGTSKRGHRVRHLALVESRHASAQPVAAATAPPPVVPLPPVLRLVSQLTCLRCLDLRGVDWACPASGPALPYFLSDLHLIAPRLRALKVGTEPVRQWTPGWWRRIPELAVLVVSSRREQAAVPASAAAAAEAPRDAPPLRLEADFMAMLSCPDRPWRVKLWCPLARESVAGLLAVPSAAAAVSTASPPPPAGTAPVPALACSFPSVRELCLNLQGNTEVCMWLSDSGESAAVANGAAGGADSPAAGADGGKATKPKAKRGAPVETVGDTPLFPSLATLTIANVDENVMAAAEVLGRFFVLAPVLCCFNVCNTTRLPIPERPKGGKRPKPVM